MVLLKGVDERGFVFYSNYDSRKGGELAAKSVVQLPFATGKSFTVDGLREKLRELFRQEVDAEVRARVLSMEIVA